MKITSSVFSTLRENLFALNQLFKCSYHGWFAYLDFLQTYLHEKDLYHKQNNTFCSIKLPYGDH